MKVYCAWCEEVPVDASSTICPDCLADLLKDRAESIRDAFPSIYGALATRLKVASGE